MLAVSIRIALPAASSGVALWPAGSVLRNALPSFARVSCPERPLTEQAFVSQAVLGFPSHLPATPSPTVDGLPGVRVVSLEVMTTSNETVPWLLNAHWHSECPCFKAGRPSYAGVPIPTHTALRALQSPSHAKIIAPALTPTKQHAGSVRHDRTSNENPKFPQGKPRAASVPSHLHPTPSPTVDGLPGVGLVSLEIITTSSETVPWLLSVNFDTQGVPALQAGRPTDGCRPPPPNHGPLCCHTPCPQRPHCCGVSTQTRARLACLKTWLPRWYPPWRRQYLYPALVPLEVNPPRGLPAD